MWGNQPAQKVGVVAGRVPSRGIFRSPLFLFKGIKAPPLKREPEFKEFKAGRARPMTKGLRQALYFQSRTAARSSPSVRFESLIASEFQRL